MSKMAKFKKALEKKASTTNSSIGIGLSEIPEWISSGNMGLNYIASGHPEKFIPVSRQTFLSGPKGSGKSFLVGNMIANAIEQGYYCVLIDSENAIDEEFLAKLGVDVHDEEKFMAIRVFSIEEATTVVSELLKNTDPEDKIGLFIDSLSNMESSQEIDKFNSGELASTQGLVQKKYKQLIKSTGNRIGDRNVFSVYTTHVYQSQEKYGEEFVVSGGSSIQFLPSIGVMMKAVPMKEGRDLLGVTVRCKTYKTRYQQSYLSTEFDIPWNTGMNKLDGITPILEDEGILERNGAWYNYIDVNGEVQKFQSKNIGEHIDELMKRFNENHNSTPVEKDDADANVENVENQSDD